MFFGRKRAQAAPPPTQSADTDKTVQLAMESLESAIDRTKKSRVRIQEITRRVVELTKRG